MSFFGSWCFIRAQKVTQRGREEERKEVGREEGSQRRKGGKKQESKADQVPLST